MESFVYRKVFGIADYGRMYMLARPTLTDLMSMNLETVRTIAVPGYVFDSIADMSFPLLYATGVPDVLHMHEVVRVWTEGTGQ